MNLIKFLYFYFLFHFMRLFVAIDLEELKDYFAEIQKQIPSDIAKLKPVKSFHLTLKFLGESDKTEEIKHALSKTEFDQFKLKLAKKLGVFPSEGYIKVIWIGLEGDDELKSLQRQIEEGLEHFHLRKDFEFTPHLTLARVKFISNKPEFLKKLKDIEIEPKEVLIKEFKLIKSELTREGPIYTELGAFKSRKSALP